MPHHGRQLLDHRLETAGLGVEFGGRGGRLLSGGRVGLGNPVHVGDCASDLIDPLTLLLGSGRDLGDQGVHAAGLVGDFVETTGHLLADARALFALGRGIGNLLGRFPGGLHGALGERTHLVGDDREAEAGVAGAGCFHRGIEGQQVGLKGNLVDRLDDFGNLSARRLDGAHRRLHLLHVIRTRVGGLAGLIGELFGGHRILGIAPGHTRHFLQRCTALLEGGGLTGRPLRHGLTGRGDLRGGVPGLLRPFNQAGGDTGDRAIHTADDDDRADQTDHDPHAGEDHHQKFITSLGGLGLPAQHFLMLEQRSPHIRHLLREQRREPFQFTRDQFLVRFAHADDFLEIREIAGPRIMQGSKKLEFRRIGQAGVQRLGLLLVLHHRLNLLFHRCESVADLDGVTFLPRTVVGVGRGEAFEVVLQRRRRFERGVLIAALPGRDQEALQALVDVTRQRGEFISQHGVALLKQFDDFCQRRIVVSNESLGLPDLLGSRRIQDRALRHGHGFIQTLVGFLIHLDIRQSPGRQKLVRPEAERVHRRLQIGCSVCLQCARGVGRHAAPRPLQREIGETRHCRKEREHQRETRGDFFADGEGREIHRRIVERDERWGTTVGKLSPAR